METAEKPILTIDLENYRGDKNNFFLVYRKNGENARQDSKIDAHMLLPGKILIKIPADICGIGENFLGGFLGNVIVNFCEQSKKELNISSEDEKIIRETFESAVKKKIYEKFLFEGSSCDIDLNSAINQMVFISILDVLLKVRVKKIIQAIEKNATEKNYWMSVNQLSAIVGLSVPEVAATLINSKNSKQFVLTRDYKATTKTLYKKYNSFWHRLFN